MDKTDELQNELFHLLNKVERVYNKVAGLYDSPLCPDCFNPLDAITIIDKEGDTHECWVCTCKSDIASNLKKLTLIKEGR